MNGSGAWPWDILGIARTGDVDAVRRAYAARLKAMDAELDADAYARLRQARDAALRHARSSLPTGAGTRPDAGHAPHDGGGPPDAKQNILLIPTPGTLPGAMTAPNAPAKAADDSQPARQADARHDTVRHDTVQHDIFLLGQLLSDQDGGNETPLTDAGESEARACLRALLAQAATVDLAHHDAIDHLLLAVMSRSWPRCAPLLEETARAMGWVQLAGKLGESKPMAFLNARLAGYLFQRDVQAPSHPLHAAWAELSKPGRMGGMRAFLLKFGPLKPQIRQLLARVRHQFPEIETFLDPQRVASWEEAMLPVRRETLRAAWYLFIALSTAISIGFTMTARPPSPPAIISPADMILSDPRTTPARDGAIATIFGPGKTMVWLRAHQPDLANWFADLTLVSGITDADALTGALDREVRRRTLLAARREGGADLDAAMRIQAGLLAWSRQAGGNACHEFLTKRILPDKPEQPDALRAQQQKLASRLAEAGKLLDPDLTRPVQSQVQIPAPLVKRVMDATGFDQRRLTRAMQGTEQNQDRCTLKQALITATLAWHGPERTAILHTLSE